MEFIFANTVKVAISSMHSLTQEIKFADKNFLRAKISGCTVVTCIVAIKFKKCICTLLPSSFLLEILFGDRYIIN